MSVATQNAVGDDGKIGTVHCLKQVLVHPLSQVTVHDAIRAGPVAHVLAQTEDGDYFAQWFSVDPVC